MTTAMQIGETARDHADFCRCFKTGAAVFLHDDGIVAHSTYRNPFRPWGSSEYRKYCRCLQKVPQSKRRAAGQTLAKSSSGLSFSNFDRRRVNNIQFKACLLEKGRQRFANASVI